MNIHRKKFCLLPQILVSQYFIMLSSVLMCLQLLHQMAQIPVMMNLQAIMYEMSDISNYVNHLKE